MEGDLAGALEIHHARRQQAERDHVPVEHASLVRGVEPSRGVVSRGRSVRPGLHRGAPYPREKGEETQERMTRRRLAALPASSRPARSVGVDVTDPDPAFPFPFPFLVHL